MSHKFAISEAAVRGDIEKLVYLMEKIGPHGTPNAEEYRTWPVFRGLRSNERFKKAFHDVFGEPVLLPRSAEIEVTTGSSEAPEEGSAKTRLH